ncbi:putative protein phosphatase 2C 27 [Sesamum angolense]|uniref:protein-serine/threonine phosphatase n=1 Tax=Sesamum angolense TaxID=2727404 RepID=A0AAE1X2W9_9LAMI|nr:putative protein phosphatase 2C 27 [Sesamum angolense]
MENIGIPRNDDGGSEGSVKDLPLHSQVDFNTAQNENWDTKNSSAPSDPVVAGRNSFPIWLRKKFRCLCLIRNVAAYVCGKMWYIVHPIVLLKAANATSGYSVTWLTIICLTYWNGKWSIALESISEDSTIADRRQILLNNFLPALRSGEWSDIGGRSDMEDTHICIPDLARNFGCTGSDGEVISFYGVFDGHGGKGAAQFVRDHLPRIIVEDVDFPLELEKVVTRSFMETDAAFAKSCSVESTLSSGTTALTVMIFGRITLWSRDVNTCGKRKLIESLGGYFRNVHIKGLKEGDKGGPLSAEPELKLMTLTKEDEFLIIGSDGIWDVFRSQNAVDFARRRLQEHNNVKLCCKDIVNEAKKRGATDNLTVVMVCFHSEPPPAIVAQRPSKFGGPFLQKGFRTLSFCFKAKATLHYSFCSTISYRE